MRQVLFLKLQRVWEASEALNERADCDSNSLGCNRILHFWQAPGDAPMLQGSEQLPLGCRVPCSLCEDIREG